MRNASSSLHPTDYTARFSPPPHRGWELRHPDEGNECYDSTKWGQAGARNRVAPGVEKRLLASSCRLRRFRREFRPAETPPVLGPNQKPNSVTISFNKCTSQPAHRAHRGNIITWSAPLTRGANTLSSGRDQGGRRSKTVAAASARALKPVGVDRGRRRSRLAPLGLSPSLAGQGFRAYGCERQVHG